MAGKERVGLDEPKRATRSGSKSGSGIRKKKSTAKKGLTIHKWLGKGVGKKPAPKPLEDVGVHKKKGKKMGGRWGISLGVLFCLLFILLYDMRVVPDVLGIYAGVPKEDRQEAVEKLDKVETVLQELDLLGQLEQPLHVGYKVSLSEGRGKGKVLVLVTVTEDDWQKRDKGAVNAGLKSMYSTVSELMAGMRLEANRVDELVVKVRLAGTWVDLARVSEGFLGRVTVEVF